MGFLCCLAALLFHVAVAGDTCVSNAEGVCETSSSSAPGHLDAAALDIQKICPFVDTWVERFLLNAIGKLEYLVKPATFLGLWPKGIDPKDFSDEYFTALYFIVSRVVLRIYKTRNKDWVNVPFGKNDASDVFNIQDIYSLHADIDGAPNFVNIEAIIPGFIMRHAYVPMYTCFFDLLRKLAVSDHALGGVFDDALNDSSFNTWEPMLEKGGFKTKLEWVRAFYDGITGMDGVPQWPPQMTDFNVYQNGDLWDDRTEHAIAFHLIGQHRVESGKWNFLDGNTEITFPFRIPCNDFSSIAVREGFGQYGVDLYFNEDGMPVFLVTPSGDHVKRGDKQWQYWKFVWRSTLLTLAVTATDHLHFTHYRVSNVLSRSNRIALSPTHPLRRITSIFSFSGIMINSFAVHLLLGPNHNLHRATGIKDFTSISRLLPQVMPDIQQWPAINALFDDEVYDKLHPRLREAPFFADGRLIARALAKMVDSFIAVFKRDGVMCDQHGFQTPESYALSYEIYAEYLETGYQITKDVADAIKSRIQLPCDQYHKLMGDRLKRIFFIVSAWHRHVGFVGDYYENPDFASMSWKQGEAFGRPKQHMILSIINVFTSTSNPKLTEDFTHLFQGMKPDYADEFTRIWKQFVEDLNDVEVEVDKRNEKRSIVNFNFNPRFFESSVAK